MSVGIDGHGQRALRGVRRVLRGCRDDEDEDEVGVGESEGRDSPMSVSHSCCCCVGPHRKLIVTQPDSPSR